ncbi:MAG: hypothetical protein AAFW84_09735 [Cyanobacteria bacterium J06635_15]
METVIIVSQIVINIGAVAGLGYKIYERMTGPVLRKISSVHQDVKRLQAKKERLEDRLDYVEFYLHSLDDKYMPYEWNNNHKE